VATNRAVGPSTLLQHLADLGGIPCDLAPRSACSAGAAATPSSGAPRKVPTNSTAYRHAGLGQHFEVDDATGRSPAVFSVTPVLL
jgi:hypothetical protein